MGRQDNQALTWIAEQLSKLSLGQLLMKPVDDQFLKKKKKKRQAHFMLCKRRDSHEAF